MKSLRCCIQTIVSLGLALSGLAAFGQTAPTSAPAASPAPAPANPEDQVITMDAFEVPASSVNGYVASESTTGTRVAAKIADLPFVVDVVTRQFMSDFDFFDIGKDMTSVSSVSAVDEEGNYNSRGFSGTFNLWNGFYRLGLVDPVNIDSFTVIKGPSASIYGQTSPAGIPNYITMVPTPTEAESVEFIGGSFGVRRVQGNFNETLGSLFGVKIENLVSFDGYNSDSVVPWFYQHQRALSDAMKLVLNDHSTLLLQVDWYKNLSNQADAEQLLDTDNTGKVFTGALAPIALARFSQGGPNERQNREMTTFYEEYENQLSDVWSLRVGSYGYDRHNSEIFNGISADWSPALGEVVGISSKPTRTILNEDGGAAQADLVAHYYLFNHSVDNKTLLTLDWSENWRYRLETEVPTNVATFVTVQNPLAPNYNGVPDYPAWTIVSRNDKTRWDTNGVFLHDQATLIGDRLIFFGGIRKDQVTSNLDFGNQYSNKAPFAIATPGAEFHVVAQATTPAAGANFKVIESGPTTIALYANYSQSFQATPQTSKLGNTQFPNTRGFGEDYGIKANLLNNKLIFTLGGFYATENGIQVSIVDPVTNVSDTLPGGSQNSKGIEFDSTYQVTDSFYLAVGGGTVDARLIKEGTEAGPTPGSIINNPEDGRRPAKVPVDNAYGIANYNFKRWGLAGLTVFARWDYDGLSYPESTASTAVEAAITLPAYWTADAGVRYQWAGHIGSAKVTNTLGFNVKNLTNADYVDINMSAGNSRGYYISYEIAH